MTLRSMRPTDTTETAPAESKAGQILTKLRTIAKKTWDEFRESLILESEIVYAVVDALGKGKLAHKGPRGKTGATWLDVLDGGRRMLVGDLARMFTSYRPDAQAAADRVLAILAARRGKMIAPLPVSAGQIHDVLDTAQREITDVSTAVTRALAGDGRYTRAELEVIVAETQQSLSAVTLLHATAVQALERA
jgi:hypothetical protein